MKNAIISAIILIMIVSFLILDSIFLTSFIRSLSYTLECMSDLPSNELELAYELKDDWSSHELAITMTVPRSKSDAVETALAKLGAYTEASDTAGFLAAKQAAMLALDSIRASVMFSFDTIF